jgi:hypothetical protein
MICGPRSLLCVVTAAVLCAAPAVAGLVRQITNSAITSETASFGDFGNTIAWNNGVTTSTLTENIPVCSSATPGALLTIVDEAGLGTGGKIALTPVSGTTINNSHSSYDLTKAHESITLQCDSFPGGSTTNWLVVQTGGAPISPTTYAPITVKQSPI